MQFKPLQDKDVNCIPIAAFCPFNTLFIPKREHDRLTPRDHLLIYSCIVSVTIMCFEFECFRTSFQIKDNCLMQNSLSPARIHFTRGLQMVDCDMVMIATHERVSELSVVKSRFRHCGQTEQSNPTDFHAMVVRS